MKLCLMKRGGTVCNEAIDKLILFIGSNLYFNTT